MDKRHISTQIIERYILKGKTFALIVLGGGAILLTAALLLRSESKETRNPLPPPSWRGVTPDQTTEEELLRLLGKPNYIVCANFDQELDGIDILQEFWRCLSGGSIYFYNNDHAQVLVQSKRVWAIKLNSLAFSEDLHLSDFINMYGKPQRVAWSKESVFDRAFVFAERGVLLHARADLDVSKAALDVVIYFSPMSLEQTLKTFRRELSITDHPSAPSDIDPGPLDPWGFNR